jgi:THAP4-like, heme-binding beta-barrel domain
MTKPMLGISVGAGLGLLDGLSAWAYPEARAMIVSIMISSTVKGILTGVATGWMAQRWKSLSGGIAAGLVIGFALSTIAALPVASDQPSRYFDIVLPGMVLGAIVGFVTQRYPPPTPAPPGRPTVGLALLLCALPATLGGQQPASGAPDPLQPLAFLIGRWEGTSEGQPGKAKVEREYRRALNSRFIHGRNRSEYPPQEKNPKGEIHEDEGWFSFDGARKRIVLRQFHVEGFVNQYVEDPPSSAQKLVFTTESIENIPPGWRARETYIVHGPDEFEEVFELAQARKDFELYSRARLKRVR